MTRSIALPLASMVLLALGCSDKPAEETEQPSSAGGESGYDGGAGGSDPGTAGDGQGGATSAGTGGGAPKPLQYGTYAQLPATVTEADARAAYDAWKEGYVEDCGSNGVRVIGKTPDETLSEGIGFGALLSVAYDDRETFDGLRTFYRKAAAASDASRDVDYGLMGWYVGMGPCALGEVFSGAAVGADLNMAMALLQAECRWGGGEYFAEASKLIASIRKNATAEVDGRTVLLATAGSTPADDPCSNPSYYSPAYYRVFARVLPEEAAFWNKFADDSLALLAKSSNNETKLAPDWSAYGNEACPSEDPGYVGYDGIRTVWRVATDFSWFGTEASKTWLRDVTGYFGEEVGIDQLIDMKDGFFVDGTGMLTTPGQGNSAFVGAVALSSIAMDQPTTDSFHQVFLDVPSANDDGYYPDTARAIYLLLSVNKFSLGCY